MKNRSRGSSPFFPSIHTFLSVMWSAAKPLFNSAAYPVAVGSSFAVAQDDRARSDSSFTSFFIYFVQRLSQVVEKIVDMFGTY